MKTYTARICKRTGAIEFLGGVPPGLVLPLAKRQRFSEIIPVNPDARRLFRLLRWVFGEEGRVSEWTRRWRCQWEAIILLGSMAGTRRRSDDRAFLLHWERQMFLAHGATS